jgi:hypothetical protein
MQPPPSRARSSRRRYGAFVEDYALGRLDARLDAASGLTSVDASSTPLQAGDRPPKPAPWLTGRRREYLREYLRWLWPHRYGLAFVFGLALAGAGLQMVEPLFMRFIIDSVLLTDGLAADARLQRLHLAGGLFVLVVIATQIIELLKNYRQRLLNTKVMLSLRRTIGKRFERRDAEDAGKARSLLCVLGVSAFIEIPGIFPLLLS